MFILIFKVYSHFFINFFLQFQKIRVICKKLKSLSEKYLPDPDPDPGLGSGSGSTLV